MFYSCLDPSQQQLWVRAGEVKTRIMEYSVHPTTPLGVRLAAIKFLQRVILVHSKGASDPRVNEFSTNIILYLKTHLFRSLTTWIPLCIIASKSSRPSSIILPEKSSISQYQCPRGRGPSSR